MKISYLRNKIFQSLFAILIVLLIISIWFFLYGRGFIEDLYNGNTPGWINALVLNIYPRFDVEKERHSYEFFWNKANQIFLRATFIVFLGLLIHYYHHKKNIIKTFFSGITEVSNVKFLRIIFYLTLILYTADWYSYLIDYLSVVAFYQPVAILKFLNIGYPNKIVLQLFWTIYIISIILSIGNIYPVASSIVVLFSFLIMQGFLYSFGKINHAYATYGYVGMVLPFLLNSKKYKAENNILQQDSWALVLIQFILAISYLFSGLEKLFNSGFEWVTSNTLKTYLVFYKENAVFNLLDYDFIVFILPIMVLLFQIGFILICFFKRIKWVILIMGVFFHVGIYLFTGIGALIHPWYLLYIFFIDWHILKNLTINYIVRS